MNSSCQSQHKNRRWRWDRQATITSADGYPALVVQSFIHKSSFKVIDFNQPIIASTNHVLAIGRELSERQSAHGLNRDFNQPSYLYGCRICVLSESDDGSLSRHAGVLTHKTCQWHKKKNPTHHFLCGLFFLFPFARCGSSKYIVRCARRQQSLPTKSNQTRTSGTTPDEETTCCFKLSYQMLLPLQRMPDNRH
jgi:hypothetical protein